MSIIEVVDNGADDGLFNLNASWTLWRTHFCGRMSLPGFYFAPKMALLGACIACAMVQEARAACKMSFSDAGIAFFIAKPERLLEEDTGTGRELAYRIRTYASFNHATLMAVAKLVAPATEEQKKAIGEGLAMAVVACLSRDGETARQIADVVRLSSDPDVLQGYTIVASADDPPPKRTGSDEDQRSSGIGLDGAIGAVQ